MPKKTYERKSRSKAWRDPLASISSTQTVGDLLKLKKSISHHASPRPSKKEMTVHSFLKHSKTSQMNQWILNDERIEDSDLSEAEVVVYSKIQANTLSFQVPNELDDDNEWLFKSTSQETFLSMDLATPRPSVDFKNHVNETHSCMGFQDIGKPISRTLQRSDVNRVEFNALFDSQIF
jgi:hypothetical protein